MTHCRPTRLHATKPMWSVVEITRTCANLAEVFALFCAQSDVASYRTRHAVGVGYRMRQRDTAGLEPEFRQQIVDLALIGNDIRLAFRIDLRAIQQGLALFRVRIAAHDGNQFGTAFRRNIFQQNGQ